MLVVLGAAYWILNVSRPGDRVEGCLQGCASAPAGERNALRIMSLNVLHGRPEFENLSGRLDLVAQEIVRVGANVVLLQEVPWTRALGNGAEYLARQVGYNYAYLRANGNRRAIFFEEGEAILSRFPLRNPTFIELRPRAGFFEHRVVLAATADSPQGNLRLFVTHLTNGEETINQAQATALASFVAETAAGPAVVAGDFNAPEDSPQLMALSQQWVDSYRVFFPDDAGLTCCVDDLHAGPEEELEERIDYIFLVTGEQQKLRLQEVQSVADRPFLWNGDWQWVSDHIGLLISVEIGP